MFKNLYSGKSFAIDLGNNNTLVTDKNNILLDQPSYIVIDNDNQSVKAVGEEAYDMFEKTHHNLKTVRPLKGGVIADYDSAHKMVKALVERACPGKSIFSGYDNIICGVPFYTTEVERRALRDALEQFNSSNIFLLYEPIAAAIGIGLDITQPDGQFLIDIGGGLTEVVVISLSGVVSFQSLRVAGNDFDEEIQEYFRRTYNLSIGLKTAEQIKIQAGAAIENIKEKPEPFQVVGKDLITGIPVMRLIDHVEVAAILDIPLSKIELTILQALENCPPELAGDIYGNGVYLTGGGSLLRGVKERLEAKIKLKVHHDEEPFFSVSKGISKVLNDPDRYKAVLFK